MEIAEDEGAHLLCDHDARGDGMDVALDGRIVVGADDPAELVGQAPQANQRGARRDVDLGQRRARVGELEATALLLPVRERVQRGHEPHVVEQGRQEDRVVGDGGLERHLPRHHRDAGRVLSQLVHRPLEHVAPEDLARHRDLEHQVADPPHSQALGRVFEGARGVLGDVRGRLGAPEHVRREHRVSPNEADHVGDGAVGALGERVHVERDRGEQRRVVVRRGEERAELVEELRGIEVVLLLDRMLSVAVAWASARASGIERHPTVNSVARGRT
jgi:hypothetical protein